MRRVAARCDLAVGILVLALGLSACQSVPSLEAAKLIAVQPATPSDIERFARATEKSRPAASGEMIAYPGSTFRPVDFPKVILIFRSTHNPEKANDLLIDLYPCSQKKTPENGGFIEGVILERSSGAPAGEEREYELLFNYRNSPVRQPADTTVTLQPMTEDLCIAFKALNWPVAAPTLGPPMRIPRETINAAVGPLPRVLTIRRPVP